MVLFFLVILSGAKRKMFRSLSAALDCQLRLLSPVGKESTYPKSHRL